MLNKYGERTQPCRTPLLTRNHSDSVPAALTLASCFPYSLASKSIKCRGYPMSIIVTHNWPYSLPILYNGAGHAPEIAPFLRRYGPPPNTGCLEPTGVHNPNGISIGSAVFAWLTVVSNRPPYSDSSRPHLMRCIAMRPNNNRPNNNEINSDFSKSIRKICIYACDTCSVRIHWMNMMFADFKMFPVLIFFTMHNVCLADRKLWCFHAIKHYKATSIDEMTANTDTETVRFTLLPVDMRRLWCWCRSVCRVHADKQPAFKRCLWHTAGDVH